VKKLINQSLPLALIAICSASLTIMGCGSAEVTEDQTPRETPMVHENAPDPDRLADAPCGEPDWSQAPPDVVSLEEAQD
jgi:hypothetical protein